MILLRRNKNVVVNVAGDGFEDTVITKLDESVEFYEEMTEKYISYLFDDTPVGRAFYNVCYKRSCVLSEVADTYLYNIKRGEDGLPVLDENGKAVKEYLTNERLPSVNGKFRIMQQNNIDIIKMALDATKKRGIECWFSFRMNDHHCPDDPMFNSSFHYDNAKEIGVFGSNVFIDYTKKAVRNYYKNYIKELCENYDIDGIEFDFLRSCPIMTDVSDENIEIVNEFLRELREIINDIAKNKGTVIQTAARTFATIERNECYGLAPSKWIGEGLIDLLILENWYIPTFYDIPVKKWREYIKQDNKANHKYTLLCGTDYAIKCGSDDYHTKEMNMSLEQVKGFVSASYQNGADGIYFFNFFTDTKPFERYLGIQSSDLSYYINENGEKICKKDMKNKFSVANSQKEAECGEREYVLTFAFGEKPTCPVLVENWIPYVFEINTGASVKSGNFTVMIGVDDIEEKLGVSVNGAVARQISDMPKANDFVWKENKKPNEMVDHISEVAFKVLRFTVDDLSAIKDGYNKIVVYSKGGQPQVLRWIGVSVNAD